MRKVRYLLGVEDQTWLLIATDARFHATRAVVDDNGLFDDIDVAFRVHYIVLNITSYLMKFISQAFPDAQV